ncbi:MAG: Uma2 family endonuclease [Chloroflexota bacterium]
MRTTFVMDPPPIVEDWLAQRHAQGQDLYDEVWEGEYHVAAAPTNRHAQVQTRLVRLLGPRADSAGLLEVGPCNIGRPTDFRVPDLAFLRREEHPVWNPTAAIVVEVVSPGDESRRKFAFYHLRGVEEVLIVDPDARTVEWFVRASDAFVAADGSQILALSGAELADALDWPAS